MKKLRIITGLILNQTINNSIIAMKFDEGTNDEHPFSSNELKLSGK